MEVFPMEVDLERAACLHWPVHGDIHGVSVGQYGSDRYFFQIDVEHLQISPVWRSPDNTWETH